MKDDAIIDDLRKRNIQPEGAHYAQLNSIPPGCP